MELLSMKSRQEWMQIIREIPKEDLKTDCEDFVPTALMPPDDYLSTLSDADSCLVYRSCMLLYMVTNRKLVPRRFQLDAMLATMNGQDAIVNAGTGSGKTLCMVLPKLLDPKSISVVISPLKRLQINQVKEFERYGVPTVAINEDTPNDPVLWKSIAAGNMKQLVIQPEQLQHFNGHLPKFAQLCQNRKFIQTIQRVWVDETHTIYTAGLTQYGVAPFRPGWGLIGHFRTRLSKDTSVQALSGTLPPHILAAVIKNLLIKPNYKMIKVSSNRPNIYYATHPIIGPLSDFRNLEFVLPLPFFPPLRIPKTIIFHDNCVEANNAAVYLDHLLPPDLRKLGLIRHYHSGMSQEYLEETYESFNDPDGPCIILCATSGAATGVDIPDIERGIQYGMVGNQPDFWQRAGRPGRTSTIHAVFLLMYESWALEVDLSDVISDLEDPDRPLHKLTKTSSKKDRTGLASFQYVQSITCLRDNGRAYLNDTSPEALYTTWRECCDRPHDGSDTSCSHLSRWFHNAMFSNETKPINVMKRKAPVKYRSVALRPPLLRLLFTWRDTLHSVHVLRAVRPRSWILDKTEIKKLATTHPIHLQNTAALVSLLDASDEWQVEFAAPILAIIHAYDAPNVKLQRELKKMRTKATLEEKNRRCPQTSAMTQTSTVEQDAQPVNESESDDEPIAVMIKRKKVMDTRKPGRRPLAEKLNTHRTQKARTQGQ